MLCGILPLSPSFLMSGYESFLPYKNPNFPKTLEFALGKWRCSGGPVGFTGRENRAQPHQAARGLLQVGDGLEPRPPLASSPCCSPPGCWGWSVGSGAPAQEPNKAAPSTLAGGAWRAVECVWAPAISAPTSSTTSFHFSSPCHFLKIALLRCNLHRVRFVSF